MLSKMEQHIWLTAYASCLPSVDDDGNACYNACCAVKAFRGEGGITTTIESYKMKDQMVRENEFRKKSLSG